MLNASFSLEKVSSMKHEFRKVILAKENDGWGNAGKMCDCNYYIILFDLILAVTQNTNQQKCTEI